MISPDIVMERAVECTHCKVTMTSWSAPGSPIRYYQCPFCARTHSSQYGEVFRRGAGARVLETVPRSALPTSIPMATAEDVKWARVKASAARWFARLQAEESERTPLPTPVPLARVRRVELPEAVGLPAPKAGRPLRKIATPPPPPAAVADDVPVLDPADVVEITPVRRR